MTSSLFKRLSLLRYWFDTCSLGVKGPAILTEPGNQARFISSTRITTNAESHCSTPSFNQDGIGWEIVLQIGA